MEGLHVAMEDAVAASIFRGISFQEHGLRLSHLFYADDALFIGEWDEENIQNLITILNCFYLVSGLRINLLKSNLFGVGVEAAVVQALASYTGCSAASFPFTYLGLPVGENMGRLTGWRTVVDRFHKRLSSWKIKMLSIGGRLTLVKSVLGSLGIYFMSMFKMPKAVVASLESSRARFFWGADVKERRISWVKWDLILNSKQNGGLDVGSLAAFNSALLYKWRWRFLNDSNALWVRLIKIFHGDSGGFSNSRNAQRLSGVWSAIVRSINQLHDTGMIPYNSISRVVGSGEQTRFWSDMWCGHAPLRDRFPRLYALTTLQDGRVCDFWSNQGWRHFWRRQITRGVLAEQLSALDGLLEDIQISQRQDRWEWAFETDGVFSVRSVRQHIDFSSLPAGTTETRWNRFMPIKLNILLWRVMLDRIPTRNNLAIKGIDIPSTLCPVCAEEVEDVGHLIFKCQVAVQVWRRVGVWINESIPVFDSVSDMMDWVDSRPAARMERAILDSVCLTVIWVLWTYRNAVVFQNTSYRKHLIYDNIVAFSFN